MILRPLTRVPTYVHRQDIAAAVWSISHNLGKYPTVTIVDSSGRQVYGDVEYTDMQSLTVRFSGAFSGRAYLN